MLFGVDWGNFTTAVMAIVGVILAAEKTIKWLYNKFNYAHEKVNEADEIKETINQHIEEIKLLQKQNQLIIEAVKNILRDTLRKDCLRHVNKKSITQEELEEYQDTYDIYKALGGNGVGTKYHDDVMHLPIIE